ncbi:hypothetical protein IU487_32960 [Nocardia puris]|uniref:hypothetical protein n=1 Tax=Nocardia puris TaxID=208602 RepID=UPI0018944428|nr:hypothetical protein [Nocardia puris]MBF6215811.1 hypothetical protein [Nocardia puris]
MTTPGPTWTRGRLAATLGEFYGRGPRGGVNVAAAAADLEVSTARVRRWLRGSNDQPAAIPPEWLRVLTTGGERVEREAAGKAAYAREAMIEIGLPKGRAIKQQWREMDWLEPHFVLLIQLRNRPWRQLILTKSSLLTATSGEPAVLDRAVVAADLASKRGTLLDEVVVANKFAGDVLIAEVMRRQAPWAVRPPKSALPTGRGQVWAEDAPELNLSALADEMGVR